MNRKARKIILNYLPKSKAEKLIALLDNNLVDMSEAQAELMVRIYNSDKLGSPFIYTTRQSKSWIYKVYREMMSVMPRRKRNRKNNKPYNNRPKYTKG